MSGETFWSYMPVILKPCCSMGIRIHVSFFITQFMRSTNNHFIKCFYFKAILFSFYLINLSENSKRIFSLRQFPRSNNDWVMILCTYFAWIDVAQAERNMKTYGKVLINEAPKQTTELLKKLCTDYRPCVSKYICNEFSFFIFSSYVIFKNQL